MLAEHGNWWRCAKRSPDTQLYRLGAHFRRYRLFAVPSFHAVSPLGSDVAYIDVGHESSSSANRSDAAAEKNSNLNHKPPSRTTIYLALQADGQCGGVYDGVHIR